MLRGLFRRHVGVAATFAAAGALGALAACDSAPPVGLAEKRRSTVVLRPGSGVHTSSPLTLEYFALRGLGELPRLVLEVTGLPYDCVFHYMQGDWKSRATFGQLPLLHDGETTISQSRAIVRYLARKACIDGATDAEKARVDMWCEFQRDLNDKKSAVHDMAAHADAPKLKQMLDAAERQLADGDGIHFVSHSLTVADVLIFSTLHQAEEIKPGVLSPWPRLSAFVAAFAAQPAVAAYLASDARVPLTPNEIGLLPNAGLPGYSFVAPMRPGSFREEWTGHRAGLGK